MNDKEEIVLEKQKLIIIQHLSKELWKEFIALNEPKLDFSLHASFLTDLVTERLSCSFFTKTEGEYEFKWYKSWWQELRIKILPKWWIRRYPSKREVKQRIKAFSVYPSIKIENMEHKARIDFHDLYVPKGEKP